jgi:hypothetical protein
MDRAHSTADQIDNRDPAGERDRCRPFHEGSPWARPRGDHLAPSYHGVEDRLAAKWIGAYSASPDPMTSSVLSSVSP